MVYWNINVGMNLNEYTIAKYINTIDIKHNLYCRVIVGYNGIQFTGLLRRDDEILNSNV